MHKKIKIFEIERPYNFKSPFDGKAFALLLHVSDQSITNYEQNSLSEQFVSQGCRYAVCSGYQCSTWDDSIDWAALEKSNFEDNDNQFVMTTWHKDQSIDDIVFFFIRNTNYDTFTPTNFCVVILGKDDITKYRIANAIKSL